MLKYLYSFLPLAAFVLASTAYADQPLASSDQKTVSYYHDVRPLFQARCQGCHQPAKPGGQFVMTAFDHLLSGGESELPAIVPENPDESNLLELITPVDGAAEMPKEGDPLDERQVNMIRQWIAAHVFAAPRNHVTRFFAGWSPSGSGRVPRSTAV